MNSPAFIAAERAGRTRRPASAAQRHKLVGLAKRAGVEVPRVYWSCDASDAIERLEKRMRQPMLEGFSA